MQPEADSFGVSLLSSHNPVSKGPTEARAQKRFDWNGFRNSHAFGTDGGISQLI
jgi:hypothetical protein